MSSQLVGKSVSRVDGTAKVTGAALYIDDLAVEGALHGATVRSDVARGILRGITKDPAFDWRGVTVATAADIPGDNVVALIEDDQPLLAHGQIRHAYEPVALVACEDPIRLQKAVAAITLDVEPLPAVLSIEDAEAKTQIIYGEDNVQKRYVIDHELGGKTIDELILACDVTRSTTRSRCTSSPRG